MSERWFPKGRSFGLYESGGRVAPNVTSILGWRFPFDKSRWKKSEPDIDHDAVTRESAQRGTAVHLAMEKWLQSHDHTPVEEHLQWINPLQSLVSRATKTLAVEIPLHYSINGVGSYAGSWCGFGTGVYSEGTHTAWSYSCYVSIALSMDVNNDKLCT